jgi:C-terminal processing protease CtpA/Prc
MKPLRLLFTVSVLLVSSHACAFVEQLMISSFLGVKQDCATQFPEMKPALDEAFGKFVLNNTKYLSIDAWRDLDRKQLAFPRSKPLTRTECDSYLTALPSENLDSSIGEIRAEMNCRQQAEREYDTHQGKRVAFGIEMELKVPGAQIRNVRPNSPAQRAGLRKGDLIVLYGGKKIMRACEFAIEVLKTAPDTQVPFSIQRDSKTIELSISPELVEGDE